MTTPDSQPTAKPAAAERILLTAHDLFYRDGIRATGIDRVIAESGVTKVTFYRHFPSKNELILRYLDYRHKHWMSWFRDALKRHGAKPQAVVAAMAEWFDNPQFRGCAFINGVAEVEESVPEVMQVAQDHKDDMASAIAELLPASRTRQKTAQTIAVAVDGAIIQAQMRQGSTEALAALERIIEALCSA